VGPSARVFPTSHFPFPHPQGQPGKPWKFLFPRCLGKGWCRCPTSGAWLWWFFRSMGLSGHAKKSAAAGCFFGVLMGLLYLVDQNAWCFATTGWRTPTRIPHFTADELNLVERGKPCRTGFDVPMDVVEFSAHGIGFPPRGSTTLSYAFPTTLHAWRALELIPPKQFLTQICFPLDHTGGIQLALLENWPSVQGYVNTQSSDGGFF